MSFIVDGHRSQKSPTVKRFCDQIGTTLRVLETGTPWANRAELHIGLLKEAVRRDMRESNSLMSLWCYCIERRVKIHNAVPRPNFQNKGLSPYAATFGTPDDISKVCNYGWYEWVYYRDSGSFPENKEKLGRVLGPIPNEGNEMAQAVLNSKGKGIPRRTIRKLHKTEIHSEGETRKRSIFDDLILQKLGDSIYMPEKPVAPNHVPYSDNDEPASIQFSNDNDPLDDDAHGANVIAENMYAQVDPDGCRQQLLDKILDHRRKSDAVETDDMYIKTRSGKRRMRHTTAGWDLFVEWKDKSKQWIPLKILKHSNPLEVAEYAMSRNRSTQPAFAWWVPRTLRRRDMIIAGINSRVRRITHKYGIEVPRTIEEALRIDRANGEKHWQKAIDKEIKNLKVAYDILPQESKPPPGYTLSSGHLVFDVRMTLERKARWVKDVIRLLSLSVRLTLVSYQEKAYALLSPTQH